MDRRRGGLGSSGARAYASSRSLVPAILGMEGDETILAACKKNEIGIDDKKQGSGGN